MFGAYAPSPLGEMRMTICRGPCCNSEPRLHPRSSGRDLISQAGQGSLVSDSWESIQILVPEDGVLFDSGDDTRLGLSYEYVLLSLRRNEQIGAGAPTCLWDWLSVQ